MPVRPSLTLASLLLVALAAAAASTSAEPKSSPPPATAPATRPGWSLVWSDEFDGAAAAPDSKKWQYETGYVRNNEAQFYTKDRRENVRIEDGVLVIEARKERYEQPGKPGKFAGHTSGSIETRGRADWQYGRVEVRAKLPTGRGTWPAVWMMPTDGKGGWPACGEIDVMENVGYDPHVVHGTVHTKAYNHIRKTQKGGQIKLDRPWEHFHVYAVEWDANKIDFLVDDKVYHSFPNEGKGNDGWPFDKPFYLKLNLAVGGDWGGQKGIDDAIFPQAFYVDYVRIYQREKP